MKKAKFIISLVVAAVMVFAPVSSAFADSTSVAGIVTLVEVSTDVNTGITTVSVTLQDAMGLKQTVRISLETAIDLDLVSNDGEQVVIVEPLPKYIEIKPNVVLPKKQETQHPVGSAMATFFSTATPCDDTTVECAATAGLEYESLYEAIMQAHADGNGFGVIAQALWVVQKLSGNADDFTLILELKNGGDYSGLTWSDGTPVTLPDGTIPTNWGQFRKAVFGTDKKVNLGALKLLPDENDGGNTPTNNGRNNKDKEKKNNHSNNGNRNGNGAGNGNRP